MPAPIKYRYIMRASPKDKGHHLDLVVIELSHADALARVQGMLEEIQGCHHIPLDLEKWVVNCIQVEELK